MFKTPRKNNYVNAFIEGDDIVVIERDSDGNRVICKEPIEYTYYTLDPNGKHTTIFGEKCRLQTAMSKRQLKAQLSSLDPSEVYESDVNAVFRHLSANYDFEATPELKTAVYDIEVEFTEKTRYSNPDETENRIISIGVRQKWCNRDYVVLLVPDNKTVSEAEAISIRVQKKFINTNIIVAKTEAELLNIFCILIEDADVITGWNSEAYDFKYLVNRTKKILGEDGVRRFSPVGGLPREREAYNEKTKSFYTIYEPHGLVHLDYMLLYKKYTYIELTSYSLDNVSYVELDDHKVEYTGNLYELYLNDLELFIEYNIKDVVLVDDLDTKLKFIDLTNLLAHNNGVLMQTTLGTVALTEQAIINEGHYYFKEPVVFPNKPIREEDQAGAAGAFVVNPKKGVRKNVSGIDVESLYPSIIRMANMSPETLVAQINSDKTNAEILRLVNEGVVKNPTEAWHSFFNTIEFGDVIDKTDNLVTLEFNRSTDKVVATGKEIYDTIYSNPDLCVTANGTVFNTSKIGVIPSLLTRWFMERRKLKALKDEWKDKKDLATTDAEKKECDYWVSFYDQRQLAKKINLNALYGALLNKSCRFYDKRIGQSTTLTGRTVTKHMGAQVNKLVIGEYTVNGGAVVYGDSVTGDTIINTNMGKFTVEDAFNMGTKRWEQKELGKEYSLYPDMLVQTYDHELDKSYYGNINYIYRHKTTKEKWKISTDTESVIVTGDHSVMIMRNGLVQVKPCEMTYDDIMVIVKEEGALELKHPTAIELLGNFDDEYVYDVGMTNGSNNWFFGNDILLKNTDSIYFSVSEAMESMGEKYNLDKDQTIELYDIISKNVNSTFPSYLHGRFNVGLERGAYIRAERENLSDYSLFIKKKRYAMRLYDVDGRRMDTDGKKGKMKYMGIEVKRSDTPKIIQDVLVDGLETLLDGKTEQEVMRIFVDFKKSIVDMSPWLLGRPCGANAVGYYTKQYNDFMEGKSKIKPRIPGAIMGAIYYNILLDQHGEEKMTRIGDGSKVFSCKLKKNHTGFNSISIPTDLVDIPDWFKKLPFDLDTTIKSVFIKKVDNIFGVVGFNIDLLNASTKFYDNFVEDDF